MPQIRRFNNPDNNLKEAMLAMAGLLDENGHYDGHGTLYVRSTDKELLEKIKHEIYAGYIIQRRKKWYYEIKGKNISRTAIYEIGKLMHNKEKLDKWISLDPAILEEPEEIRVKETIIYSDKPEIEYMTVSDKDNKRRTRTIHYMCNNFVWLEVLEGSPYIVFTGTKEILQDLKRDNYLPWSPFIDWTHDGKTYNAIELKEFHQVIAFLTRLGDYMPEGNWIPRPWLKSIVDYYWTLSENHRIALTPYINQMSRACEYSLVTGWVEVTREGLQVL